MEALIDSRLYDRLAELRESMIDRDVGSPAHVFVPVGAPYPTGSLRMPRILYVGKATRGFGEDEIAGFANATATSISVGDRQLLKGNSAFWQFLRAILEKLAAACNQAAGEELFLHFGWSNVAKIGDEGNKNPSAKSLGIQKDICIEALGAEIAAFRPTAVVLATTNYAEDEIVYPVFGRDGWRWDTVEQDRVAYKHDARVGLIAWVNHPQGMRPAGTRNVVQDFVADLVMRHWRRDPLPECVWAAGTVETIR